MNRAILIFSVIAALSLPAKALAGTWAVGVGPAGFAALSAQLPGARTLVPGRALVVEGARPQVTGAAYVVRLDNADRKLAFDNTEPDAAQQWYLQQDDAWTRWAVRPDLAPIKIAIIDSGLDYTHPEFVGRVAAGASFVGGSWKRDTDGHGTFVAGEIAANPFNDVGIAGIAFNAQLLIAKVVRPDETVSLVGEIDAIDWAVKHGARVINLSLGGLRDPAEPDLDTFSLPEEAAIEYAYSKGVLVVAAVGNGTQAPKTPWSYADYPAALPHVLGVSALRQDGGVPDYSNRDRQFVDIAAPGGPIFSTIPRNLVDVNRPECATEPYSNCGPSEFQDGIGTSFAAPQVSAAAVLLLGVDPSLAPDQVEWLLERSAVDVVPADGCSTCAVGRDSLTGWGRLDIDAAVAALADRSDLPPPDVGEPNEAPALAHALTVPTEITATLDFWDDPVDLYSVKLVKGQRLFARLTRVSDAPTTLALWKPGTTLVAGAEAVRANRVAESTRTGVQDRLSYRAPESGRYYLEASLTAPERPADVYRLAVALGAAVP